MNYNERQSLLRAIWSAQGCVKAGRKGDAQTNLSAAERIISGVWLIHDSGQRPRELPAHTMLDVVTGYGDRATGVRAAGCHWRYVDGGDRVARYRVLL